MGAEGSHDCQGYRKTYQGSDHDKHPGTVNDWSLCTESCNR